MAGIRSFSGQYRFLSNFYRSPIVFEGENYLTVEHAYQAAKCTSEEDRLSIQREDNPGNAKKLGRRVAIRKDWENVKLGIMEKLLRIKFAPGTKLSSQLRFTGLLPLEEGNDWGDTYWGICKGYGENHLGKLLMKIRNNLRKIEGDWE